MEVVYSSLTSSADAPFHGAGQNRDDGRATNETDLTAEVLHLDSPRDLAGRFTAKVRSSTLRGKALMLDSDSKTK